MADEIPDQPRPRPAAKDSGGFRAGASLLRRVKEKGRFLLWRSKLALRATSRSLGEATVENPTLDVEPNKVVYDARGLRLSEPPPAVLGGDWDRRVEQRSLDDSTLMRCFRGHFLHGDTWSDTDYHGELVRELDSGEKPHGCRDRQELDRWFAGWDRFARQCIAPGASSRTADIAENLPRISIAIGRQGSLSVLDNAPSLVLSRIFELPSVPCRVALRHRKWVRFCREFRCFARTLPGGQPYQPCTHADLSRLRSSWSEERYRIIQPCLSDSSRGRLMDIGANLGYFCHRAEELGYDVLAVEPCRRLAYFIRKLKEAEGRRFQVLCGSVLDYSFEEPFAVVLALNIFHHFIKTAARHQLLVGMLARMKTREMIFQSHKPGEKQMAGAYRDYSPDEFVRFILDHSCLSHAQRLGADRGRPIYRLRAA